MILQWLMAIIIIPRGDILRVKNTLWSHLVSVSIRDTNPSSGLRLDISYLRCPEVQVIGSNGTNLN
jgi:hypothetical protein